MTAGTVTLLRGDATCLPLADGTVDLVCTSPPYFGLRSYTDGGEHYAGQIGSEATPAEFLDALIAATAEMVRVLRPSGSIWVNLGDKYARSGGVDRKARSVPGTNDVGNRKAGRLPQRTPDGIPEKSLMLLPQRYAIRCIDELGLILRAEIIWSKPNGLPESVTDRVRRSHEQWFHFTVRPRYYSAVDAIREAHVRAWGGTPNGGNTYGAMKPAGAKDANLPAAMPNPLGKLPGSVWEIPTQPLKVPAELDVDHFAAFPMEWPRRIITGWSPRHVCTACGEGRRPVVDRDKAPDRPGRVQLREVDALTGAHGPDGRAGSRHSAVATITGEACACPDATAPSTPGVVLDPFGGTGTTALVASVLGRHGVHVDRSGDYCRLAAWRTTDPGEIARAMQVDRPPAVDHGTDDLLGMLTDGAA